MIPWPSTYYYLLTYKPPFSHSRNCVEWTSKTTLGGKHTHTQKAKLGRCYRHNMLSSHFLKVLSIIQLKKKKIHLLFRSYLKPKFFLRRVAQNWKSLLRKVINSLSKKVFKAELETIMAGFFCCLGWWEVQVKSSSPLFPKTSSSKGNGHPAFFSDTSLSLTPAINRKNYTEI